MSLLTPERVPVKVYKWDDIGAPVLNKSSGCMMDIFKSCLVTGYGTKDGAGWTMPFENTGVKVLRPEVSPHTDFYLRLSADTGTKMAAQVYLNMTDTDTGDLKLQGSANFGYAQGKSTAKWILVASSRAFWYFCEHGYLLDTPSKLTKSGAYFFVGDTMRDDKGSRAVYLQHTGGTYGDGDYSDIFGWYRADIKKGINMYVRGSLLDDAGAVYACDAESYFNARTARAANRVLSPLLIFVNQNVYQLPGLTVPSDAAAQLNFAQQLIAMDGYISNITTFGAGANTETNFCISTDIWSF